MKLSTLRKLHKEAKKKALQRYLNKIKKLEERAKEEEEEAEILEKEATLREQIRSSKARIRKSSRSGRVLSRLSKVRENLKKLRENSTSPFNPRNAAPSGSATTRNILMGGNKARSPFFSSSSRNPFYDAPEKNKDRKNGKTIVIRIK